MSLPGPIDSKIALCSARNEHWKCPTSRGTYIGLLTPHPHFCRQALSIGDVIKKSPRTSSIILLSRLFEFGYTSHLIFIRSPRSTNSQIIPVSACRRESWVRLSNIRVEYLEI